MSYDVEYTDEFESWWNALNARAQDDVSRIPCGRPVCWALVRRGPIMTRSTARHQRRDGAVRLALRRLRPRTAGRPGPESTPASVRCSFPQAQNEREQKK